MQRQDITTRLARAAMLVVLMLLTSVTAWAWSGSGTEASPYLIASYNDLKTLHDNVNNGTPYDGTYFKQTADIDWPANTTWTSGIGTDADHRFGGHYDGDGKAIRSLTISGISTNTALFGYVRGASDGKGGFYSTTLKNIVLEDCNIDASSVSNSYAAGILAVTYFENTVENCRVSGTIKGDKAAGGIVGSENQGKVKNCFADVTVTASVQTGYNASGQFQYYTVGKIIGYVVALSSGDVTGNYYHDDGATDGAGHAVTAIGRGSSTTYSDDGRATPLYAVSCTNLTAAATNATVTHAGTHYFAAGATVTLATDGNHIISGTPTVSGTGASLGSVASDKKSMTVTVGTQDVTVSATLVTVTGTCGTNATWSLAQDGSGNYTRLTISGTGAMQDYGQTTIGGLWRTTAPWGWQTLTSVTIGDGITAIGDYAFCGCQQLGNVTIGNSVTNIGYASINHCDALTELTLPASVASIEAGAFQWDTGLTRLNIQKTDGLVTLENNDIFYQCNALQAIVVPTPALALQYQTATHWSTHATKLRVGVGSQLFTATNEGGTAACEIATEADLRHLSTAVNQDEQGCDGLTFRQTANITLSSTFTPIGLYNAPSHLLSFNGTFDGGGYTISGLSVSNSDLYSGLFGKVVSATIKNVVLVSPSVTNNYSDVHYVYVGALVGHIMDGSSVENCRVISPTVSVPNASNKHVGAIVGGISNSDGLTNSHFYSNTDYDLVGDNFSGNHSGRARKVTLGSNVSGISPAATDPANGFVYNNERYYREGLTLTLASNAPPTGYTTPVYSASGTALSGDTYIVNSTDGDATISAAFTPIPYTVQFNGNGATGGTMSNQSFTYDVAQNLTANAFSRAFTVTYNYNDNYNDNENATATATFNGWATSEDGVVAYTNQQNVSNLTATKDATVNLYAKWTDGSVTLPTPTKTGYTFGGWYSDDGLTASVGAAGDSYTPSADITLYAKWTVNTYTITYNLNGGTFTTNKNSFTIESETITLDEPTRTGYAFAGWYTNEGLTGDPVTTIAQGSTGDITLYAKWLLIYTITYHPNDGTLTTDKNSFTEESPAITLDEPTRTGYAFCGWYTNEGLTSDVVTTIAHGSTGNVELWARWTPFYTITYHLDGGTLTTDYDGYTVESPAITLDKPTRTGHVFGGWYTNEELTGDAVTTIAARSTGHREYWAKWIVDWAAESSGDDADNAYMIYNKDQLDLLAHRVNGTHGETRQADGYSGKYFKLGADIEYPYTIVWNEDFDTWVDDNDYEVNDNTENNFEAIGGYKRGNNDYSFFCGDFDGGGHTVSGIRIYSVDNRKGLFGQIGETGEGNANIHDLRLADARITGAYSVGGIVGSKQSGTISRCHVASNVTIHAHADRINYHGGIVGTNNQGTIDHCTSAATLTTAESACSYFGAIAGDNNGTLTDNLAIGATVPYITRTPNSSAPSGTYGAICGSNENEGTLARNYYIACTVAGTANATGVGCLNADVTDNYGAVPGYLLSLCEGITSSALTVGDYTVAPAGQAVTLTSGTVPLGYSFAGFTVKKTADNTDVTTDVLSGNVTDGFTITMPAYDVTVTPSLTTDPWEGEGTKDSPYIILNHSQLDLLAHRVNSKSDANESNSQYSDKYFKLGADINYPHTTDWNDANSEENNFEAIGNFPNTSQGHFNGDFDGAGHTISGIRIYKSLDYQGLFGYIGSKANIHDLRLADARITGYNNIGGIVGCNRGAVTRCHVASNVAIHAVSNNANHHGGIVGHNLCYNGQGGTIDHCSSAATLTKADGVTINYCGAIAGWNDNGTLTDNLVIGATVPACSNYGAICGYNGGTLARNYYTACTVAGTANATGVGCRNADVTDNDGAVPALRDNADNTTAIGLFADLPADLDLGWGAGKYPVALNGRTLYKDGDWNTLCLPFEVTAEQLAVATHPLFGATIMELDVSGIYETDKQTGFDAASGTLYLYFKETTSIVAGRPYIIKWETTGDNLVSPVFIGVTIDATTNNVAFTGGSFKGTYASHTFESDDRSILFMGSSNTLTWPKSGARIGACRAYFDLGSNSGGVRGFSLSFGDDEATGIVTMSDVRSQMSDVWYSLDGKKLDGVPTRKGLYINNGRKVVIK